MKLFEVGPENCVMGLICPALGDLVHSGARFIRRKASVGENGEDCLAYEEGQAGLIQIRMPQHADGEAIEQGEEDLDTAFCVIKIQLVAQQTRKFGPDDDVMAAEQCGDVWISLGFSDDLKA